jgi:polyisoprenoid-binding protein YceI
LSSTNLLTRRNLIIAAVAVVVIAAIAGAAFILRLENIAPSQTGVPTVNSLSATLTARASTPSSSVNLVSYTFGERQRPAQQTIPYTSCTEDRDVTPTPTFSGGSAPTVTTTPEATAAPTNTAVPGNTAENFVLLRVVQEESEACYQVGEVFFRRGGEYALAVGVTRSIDGEVAIDLNNISNSLIGEIVINISEFQSDSRSRDGAIREEWLESNRFPIARLQNAVAEGLPAAAYTEGEVVDFTITGDLTVRDVTRPTTFTMRGVYQENTLVVTGYADILMSDFGVQAPDMAGILRVNDEMRIVLNLVMRAQ